MKNLKVIIGVMVLLLIALGILLMRKRNSARAIALPDVIDGWTAVAPDRRYDQESLYEYIDGGAELYLSYGFNNLISRRYSKSEQPDIEVDIFDMGISQNAFGVFTHARELLDDSFGQGSQYTNGLLLFWQDRYYISILASPETAESKRASFALARAIEAAIGKEGPLPDILDWLPQPSLVEASVRYFHHPAWLNSYYFVSDQNIFHINDNTEALLAKYGEAGQRYVLLLVKYQNDSDAKSAYDEVMKSYLPELSGERVMRIEDGTWVGCQVSGNLLAAVFNASTRNSAIELLEAVQEKLAPHE